MTLNDPELTQTLVALQQAVAALTDRVALLEARLTPLPSESVAPPEPLPVSAPASVAAAATEQSDEEMSPAVLLAIAAAVAAYLGERAHVRQVRLISSNAWGQQGRVSVQASHALHR